MKNPCLYPSANRVNRHSHPPGVLLAITILSLLISHSPTDAAAEPGKFFETPAEAVNALGEAARTTNRAAFHSLFGPDSDWLSNPDAVQGAHEIAQFNSAFAETNWLDGRSATRMTLVVGTNSWPFPIPIVKEMGGWHFDTAAGRDEILNRRIGRNELQVLEVMRAYTDAQREYASRDRDNSRVLKYAQKIVSTPGKTDGLYWPPELNGESSPLGPLLAEAQNEGYFRNTSREETGPKPFHGYFFKILKRQGKHAPGGKYDYVINGNMIGGFALVAWPAQYGESGIMTFVVNQEGRVYQKDLGPETAKITGKMKTYDPDASWRLSPE